MIYCGYENQDDDNLDKERKKQRRLAQNCGENWIVGTSDSGG